jgi:hypothetical protein
MIYLARFRFLMNSGTPENSVLAAPPLKFRGHMALLRRRLSPKFSAFVNAWHPNYPTRNMEHFPLGCPAGK